MIWYNFLHRFWVCFHTTRWFLHYSVLDYRWSGKFFNKLLWIWNAGDDYTQNCICTTAGILYFQKPSGICTIDVFQLSSIIPDTVLEDIFYPMINYWQQQDQFLKYLLILLIAEATLNCTNWQNMTLYKLILDEILFTCVFHLSVGGEL